MDLSPLLQSGNWLLIAVAVAIMLLTQFAKSKLAPSTPTPVPTPADPNKPAPVAAPSLLALAAAFLQQFLLAKAKASIPPGTVTSIEEIDRKAAGHLLSVFGLNVEPEKPKT